MSKSLLDDWNDPHNRKMRELYAEQDRKMQAQDGNSDAADLAALRAENAKLREALQNVKDYLTDPQFHLEKTKGGYYIYRFTPEAMRELAILLGMDESSAALA